MPEPRLAARLVILDERDRILLVQFRDPTNDHRWWCTPGGGLDPGERFEEAARREMVEETGLREFDLGPCIWTREHRGSFMGKAFHAVERLFLVRARAFEPTDAGYTDLERQVHVDMRWWTVADLETLTPEVAPRRLAALLRDLLVSGPPDPPLNAGV